MFTLVHRHISKAKQKQKDYIDKNSKDIKFEIGDSVYYKNFHKKSKIDQNWLPHFRIVRQTSPVTFEIRNQITSDLIKAHANQLRIAKLDWSTPKESSPKPFRKAQYVIPPESSSDSESDSAQTEHDKQFSQRFRRQNSGSSAEDNIPLSQLRQILRERESKDKQTNVDTRSSDAEQMSADDNRSSPSNNHSCSRYLPHI